MHILIVPSWYKNSLNKLSGVFFEEQAKALAEDDSLNVKVIAVQELSIKDMIKQKRFVFFKKYKITKDNITIYGIEYPNFFIKMPLLRIKFNLFLFKKVFSQYKKDNGLPDIVHLHSFIMGKAALYLKQKYNIPYVVTEHSSGFARELYPLKTLNYSKKIFSNANKRLAVSQQFVNLLSQKFNLEFDYLPNIVDINEFTLKNTRVNTNIFTFINIAFLDKNKNQDMLIKAFYNAFKGKVDIQLIIAGDGSEYSNLQHLINTLKLQEQVTLYGRASRSEVKKLLQSSDAFVLSSQYETFGVVIIEAMACGLPVVSTKCGGPESIITKSELGILCEKNEDSMSRAMIEIYKNRLLYNSKKIREYVEMNFSKETVVKQLKSIYEKNIYN